VVRGFAAGAVAALTGPSLLGRLADELQAFVRLASANPPLRRAMEDASVSAFLRGEVAAELLAAHASEAAAKTASFVVRNEAPSEVLDALGAVAERIAKGVDGGDPAEIDPPVGRVGLAERLDGYVSALEELAGGPEVLASLQEELSALASALREVPQLEDTLGDWRLSSRVRRAVAAELLRGRISPRVAGLLEYALCFWRGRGLGQALGRLSVKLAAQIGKRVARVWLASALADPERQELEEALGRWAGGEVEVRFREDPSLIGGVVALVGEVLLDASLKGRLARAAAELKRAS
jgi:F-type H+-transporting ATPase subunit delta